MTNVIFILIQFILSVVTWLGIVLRSDINMIITLLWNIILHPGTAGVRLRASGINRAWLSKWIVGSPGLVHCKPLISGQHPTA